MPGPEQRGGTFDIASVFPITRQEAEEKYVSCVGLKDVEFVVDEEKRRVLRVTFPLEDFGQAEQALRAGIITPTTFLEPDGTQHRVRVFDPEPVRGSGSDPNVAYSLGLTDVGVFEVGRYWAVDQVDRHRYWQWVLVRRLFTAERVNAWAEWTHASTEQAVDHLFDVMMDPSRVDASVQFLTNRQDTGTV